MECDHWIPNLANPADARPFYNYLRSGAGHGRSCPKCQEQIMSEKHWFHPGIVDTYLPFAGQVVDAGFAQFLRQNTA